LAGRGQLVAPESLNLGKNERGGFCTRLFRDVFR
jgi:hypothetical protein